MSVRHELLREALEIIRLLWSGGYRSYQGRHLTLEDARVFDLPDTPPRIAVAVGGSEAAQLAAELGDAIFANGFLDFFARELAAPLRALHPS